MTDLFYDEWRACLRSHLQYVIQEQDRSNETSLLTVLRDTGFSEEEVRSMRHEALIEAGLVDSIEEAKEIEEAEIYAETVSEIEIIEPVAEAVVLESQTEPAIDTVVSQTEWITDPVEEIPVDAPVIDLGTAWTDALSLEPTIEETPIEAAEQGIDQAADEIKPEVPPKPVPKKKKDEPPPTQLSLF